MDTPAVLTIIGIALANIGTTIGLFIWSTNFSSEFRKECMTATEEHRRDTQAFLKAIQDEMKDFHGRLCAIEERHRNQKG